MQIRWLQIFLVTLMRLLTDSEPNRSHLEGAQLIQPKSPLEPGIKMLTVEHHLGTFASRFPPAGSLRGSITDWYHSHKSSKMRVLPTDTSRAAGQNANLLQQEPKIKSGTLYSIDAYGRRASSG